MSAHAELQHLWDAAAHARSERPDVALALATLVAVNGSSYRQPGARMLCDAEGRVLAGAISGGCLEADVAERAASVCARGHGRLVSYDLREDLETIWGFGTGCDGVAHIVLAPWGDGEAFRHALQSARERTFGVLLTVTASPDQYRVGETSFVRVPGAAALNGQRTVREFVVDTVRHTNASFLGSSRDHSITSSANHPVDVDQEVRVFGAPVHAPVHVVVVGAARGAESFAQCAAAAGWQVTVADHREAALAALTVPPGTGRIAVAAEQIADAIARRALSIDVRTCYALCTHRFEHDLAWLRALIVTRVPYIGLLGSRQRAARLLRALKESGSALRARDRARVYAPIGLDIGGDSPQSIALSAVAEMHAVLHTRPGGTLRERQAPLHTRTETPALASGIPVLACPLPHPPARERR